MPRNETQFAATIDEVLRHPVLVRGYESIRRGTPFDYDLAERDWNYERGRQLAISVRQVLSYAPAMPQAIELVRPIYITLRLDGTLLPRETLPLMHLQYADSAGRFSPQKYAARHFAPTSGPSIVDSLF